MSDLTPPPKPEGFSQWLRREFWLEAKLGLVLLAVGWIAMLALNAFWPAFAARWSPFNHQLSHVALNQHPHALAQTFANRLGDSEYGWGLLSFSEPFNVSAAREQLQLRFPEFIGLNADGTAKRRHTSRLQHLSTAGREERAAERELRAAAFLTRYHEIESRRFTRLYQAASPFDLPDATTELARMITRGFGLPDALLFILHGIVAAGFASIFLFSTVLAVAAVALWQSHRPARFWLKLLLWPGLASVLVWLAIFAMSLAAAFFGSFTPDTSALALLAFLPFLFLFAKLPLKLAEALLFKPEPAKWDGVERRRNRAPTPPAAGA